MPGACTHIANISVYVCNLAVEVGGRVREFVGECLVLRRADRWRRYARPYSSLISLQLRVCVCVCMFVLWLADGARICVCACVERGAQKIK